LDKIWPPYWPKRGIPEKTEPFTWIVKGKLAASSWPDFKLFERFKKEGIAVIINCSEFDNQKDIPNGFVYHHFKVPDYGIPSIEQIKKFLITTQPYLRESKAIVIHCVAGCGRTAQFVLAIAAKHNLIPENVDPIDWIRSRRPCSLETREQIKFALIFVQKFQQKR
jgi:protein-tyrosine phosphatase